ncbi:hypothetical protein ACFW4X_10345 [Streptomyces smyrnaeus]|uniref:Uncharacterized protein n=1 Tax=Streptomyces smyrnaeus TaxID=1387713 RepID=A0ABS3XQH4_9ACTN|nr:hypothetical protein [Streptomyces smyrnaeus]MBO8197660.1 hypothetical protein [Streptomyces smyrnaeus]
MRIRTATAAAVLASAAVLGSAGTAFAGDSHWSSFAQDFSRHSLDARVSSSDNDTTSIKKFETTNVSDNVITDFNTGARIGELELD